MKLLKSLMANPALVRLAPVIAEVDSALLCALHRAQGKANSRALAAATSYGTAQVSQALKAARKDQSVEAARAKLLTRRELMAEDTTGASPVSVASACAISKSPRQAALLAALVREFSPKCVLELGTNVGISSAYMARAMSGMLVSLDASVARISIARELHRQLRITNVEYVAGWFKDTLPRILSELPALDFAFIDGHHEYQPTLDYAEQIVVHARPGAVLVFDDIRWSEPMWRAWLALRGDNRFGLAVDFWTMGLCVVRADEQPRYVSGPIACY